MNLLLNGLITGIVFGIFMQKAKVLRYNKQIAALRYKDMTIFKFMLSAIITAMIGFYILNDMEMIKLSIKGTLLGANIVGGLIFGIGWGILGYCPGTAAGALGEGRFDALSGIIGFFTGGIIYAEIYPFIQNNFLKIGNYGKITLADLTGVNHWIVIVIVCGLFICAMRHFEKKGL
ncbi:MAG: YeeE/YedE family protein [Candidatus Muirbacterium halophilum]|nr:YeeE/YedE family protein [Candidatus Muirbacterium halophilum]MCK9475841.1 YeeE/YedE family protein [Candidatus Muirbacterium halophilum]